MVKAASLRYTMKVTWFATDQLRLISELTTSADYVSDPDDVALIQYISGSTGQPKGVMISHKSIGVNLRLIADTSIHGTKPKEDPLSECTLVGWLPQVRPRHNMHSPAAER